MTSLLLGLAAFLLYFVYDLNSFTRQFRLVHSFFTVGTLLLGAATVLDLWTSWKTGCFSGMADIVLLAGAAICFGALIYCLVFALPFQETYTEQNVGRCVYSGGVYGLCRHPGILCFFGMELLLGLAALPGGMISRSLLFSLLNLAYAYFQDRITFPKTFCDYYDYQTKVPFLIPTGAGIRRIGKMLLCAEKEEDDP